MMKKIKSGGIFLKNSIIIQKKDTPKSVLQNILLTESPENKKFILFLNFL